MTFALQKTKLVPVSLPDSRDLVVFFPLGEREGLDFSFNARGICASVSSLLNALSLAQRGIVLSVGYPPSLNVDASSAREERVRIPFSRHVLQLCAYILVFICSPNLSLKKNSRRKKRSKSRKSWAKSKSKKTARSRNGFA